MKTLDINEYTNSELEEMGIDPPCECLSTYREHDKRDDVYDVCVDCGAAWFVHNARSI